MGPSPGTPDRASRAAAVSQRLITARRERGLTQAQIARALGVANTTVSRWERGLARPHLRHVTPLANLLEKPADWFGFPERGDAARRRSKVGEAADRIASALETFIHGSPEQAGRPPLD
jgi:transcriptional regulator with XRE-family HTH domain